jgi:hypothetical protein
VLSRVVRGDSGRRVKLSSFAIQRSGQIEPINTKLLILPPQMPIYGLEMLLRSIPAVLTAAQKQLCIRFMHASSALRSTGTFLTS